LYAAMLKCLARAVKYYDESSTKRFLKSPWTDSDEIERLDDAIQQQKEKVDRCQQLLQQQSLDQIGIQAEGTLKELETLRQSLHQPINRMASQLDAMHDKLENEERRELLLWLSRIPHRRHHKAISESRLSGTGDWLLRKTEFVQWLQTSSSSVLWLHGIPGSGKSYL
ncbi:hypothetical protein K490DRAFT_22972, partial [Saccharata proteae CBS 121410]